MVTFAPFTFPHLNSVWPTHFPLHSLFFSSYPVFRLPLRSSMLQLYGNPGDYAWGQGGLDAVITEVSVLSTAELLALWHSLWPLFMSPIQVLFILIFICPHRLKWLSWLFFFFALLLNLFVFSHPPKVVGTVGKHRPTPCTKGDDILPSNSLYLWRTDR